jgi:hypothetical protein
MDFSSYQTATAIPEAGSMMETFRAMGYNAETAVADIVDNSVSAGASVVKINFDWKGQGTIISVKDNGCGMNGEELVRAMRPGSRHPSDERRITELGRFGLGLKTASFSQCRRLSVISKKEGYAAVYWTWDIDYVSQTGRWELIRYLPDEEKYLREYDGVICGTTVIWSEPDRLLQETGTDTEEALSRFLVVMERIKKHLEVVFHRFIEQRKISIYFQERQIEAWNPFMYGENGLQTFPEERPAGGKIVVKGFVLPHQSRMSEEVHRKSGGIRGWNEQQGFYIYRNERMLVGGDWLGMFRKEEHYKLARIMIDLPNSLDKEWQIDIKKSAVILPHGIKGHLRSIAAKVRAQAAEVYRHKGKILQRQFSVAEFHHIWNEKTRHGKRFYEINRKHPFIRILTEKQQITASDINSLLRFIEETIPVPLITIRESEQPEIQTVPFEATDHDPLIKAVRMMYDSLLSKGRKDREAKDIILSIEPFNLYPQYIESLNS